MKLLLGGGRKHWEGYTNIDIVSLPSVDIVADLSKGIPCADNSVDEIVAHNILSHLPDTLFIMEEMYRVCRGGARVQIKVPYFKSTAAFKDPTQIRFFTERTFELFDQTRVASRAMPDYQLKSNFKLEKVVYNYYRRGVRFLPFVNFLRTHFWDIVKSMVIELRVVKLGE